MVFPSCFDRTYGRFWNLACYWTRRDCLGQKTISHYCPFKGWTVFIWTVVYTAETSSTVARTLLHIDFTLIKKKRKVSSYIRKFRKEQLQSHIWLTASTTTNMVKYLRISSYIRKPLLLYDLAFEPIWISLCMRKSFFSFFSQGIIIAHTLCRCNT
jgi:hypothetical protein